MAGDWIKMRVWLRRDPKVIRMADTLACLRPFMDWVTDPVRRTCDETVYEHVTSDVTRALCVTGLLEVWGTAREQGDRDGDDLVIDQCDLGTLDDITGVPCFGEAMGAVGWAVERDDGSLVFPKFFADKVSPEQRHRTGAAERQARYRQRQREKEASPRDIGDVTGDVTGDVAVTGQRREEKIRGEEEKDPPTPPAGGTADQPAKRTRKVKPPQNPEAVPIPSALDSPDFRSAWADWLIDRKARGKGVTELAARQQLTDMCPLGPLRAVECIRISIRNGWAGLFPDKVPATASRPAGGKMEQQADYFTRMAMDAMPSGGNP